VRWLCERRGVVCVHVRVDRSLPSERCSAVVGLRVTLEAGRVRREDARLLLEVVGERRKGRGSESAVHETQLLRWLGMSRYDKDYLFQRSG
jgi:hypothetical protein